MKTITATLNDDGTLIYNGRTFKAEARPKIEVGTKYEAWSLGRWIKISWAGGPTDYFYKTNDLIAWNEEDKERIEKRQAALFAADEWFDENGRFEPDWGNIIQQQWFVWGDGEVDQADRSRPCYVHNFFATQANAERFATDLKEHLKWL